MAESDGVWYNVVNGRTYVTRCEGGLFQANELGSDWVSGWAETIEAAAGEIILHVTSTTPEGAQHG